tara:strand:+ start:306 stop:530 length:225 start_codon:yes stop_codon:yes gene_type:complete
VYVKRFVNIRPIKEKKVMTSRRIYEPNKNESLIDEVLTELYIIKGALSESTKVEKQLDKIRKTLQTVKENLTEG